MRRRIPEPARRRLQFLQVEGYFIGDRSFVIKRFLNDKDYKWLQENGGSWSYRYEIKTTQNIKWYARMLWRFFGREVIISWTGKDIVADISDEEALRLMIDPLNFYQI